MNPDELKAQFAQLLALQDATANPPLQARGNVEGGSFRHSPIGMLVEAALGMSPAGAAVDLAGAGASAAEGDKFGAGAGLLAALIPGLTGGHLRSGGKALREVFQNPRDPFRVGDEAFERITGKAGRQFDPLTEGFAASATPNITVLSDDALVRTTRRATENSASVPFGGLNGDIVGRGGETLAMFDVFPDYRSPGTWIVDISQSSAAGAGPGALGKKTVFEAMRAITDEIRIAGGEITHLAGARTSGSAPGRFQSIPVDRLLKR